MKNAAIIFCLFAISFSAVAQTKLKSFQSSLTLLGLDAEMSWSLADGTNAEYAPVAASEIAKKIDTFCMRPDTMERIKLVKKYKDKLKASFNDMGLIGADPGQFLSSGKDVPVSFTRYGDTALTMVITNIYVDAIYNTLKLTSRQRAAKAVTNYIIPSLKNITKNFPKGEIKYIGFTAGYGSKDFTDEYSTKGEFVCLVARYDLVKKYVDGIITEDELVDGADIYLKDRDMVVDVKKVKLTLE